MVGRGVKVGVGDKKRDVEGEEEGKCGKSKAVKCNSLDSRETGTTYVKLNGEELKELLLLLAGSTQRYYNTEVSGEEKRQENTKRYEGRESVGFSSASLFPARKREAITQGGTREIDHLMWRITSGTDIIKRLGG